MSYRWNRIHCPTVEMESCVSLRDDSFAFRLSSVKAMVSDYSSTSSVYADENGELPRDCLTARPIHLHAAENAEN